MTFRPSRKVSWIFYAGRQGLETFALYLVGILMNMDGFAPSAAVRR